MQELGVSIHKKITPRGRAEKYKVLAPVLYLSSLTISATERILGVTAQSCDASDQKDV